MKIVAKKDLVVMDGFLVNKTNLEVVPLDGLANEFNELDQFKALNEFCKKNKTDILNSEVKPVVFKLNRYPVAQPLQSDKVVKTPLTDKDKAAKIALAEEFIKVQEVADINTHLKQYRSVATWFDKDAFVYTESKMVGPRYMTDITKWTKEDVIKVVEEYHDPEMLKLRDMLKYDYS